VIEAPVIPISSDSSDESVSSHAPRVILFGTILTGIPVIRVVFLLSKSEPVEQRPERHESLTPSSEFPLAHVAPLRIHPNRPRKLLTARKRVRPFLTRRLAWRRISHHLSYRHSSPDYSSSSSSDSSSDISSSSSSDSLSDSSLVHSSRYDASSQSHSRPSTRVESPRLVYPLIRTPQCSEAFMHLRSEPLSTFYLPMTSESSLDSSFKRSLDSSSPFVRPSCKRCRSPTTLVSSSTLAPRSIALALADFLPRKRFMDSYSFEASGEEHMEISTADVETVSDLGISEGVGALTKDGIDPLVTGGIFESTIGDAPDLEEAGQLVASEERASLADRVRSLGWENLRVQALLCIERDHVNILRHHMALSQEEFRQIRRDRDDTRRRLRRLESLVERSLGLHC
nr:hypothetical protein [Tanacetum cinerariifolium]